MKKNLLLLFACVTFTIQSYAASVTFISVYNGTSTNSKFTCSTPIQGSSYKFTSVNPADALFPASNNDVPGQFSYTSGGQTTTINGMILTMVGNSSTPLAYFFVETTVLGGTTTTGRNWLLIVPGNESTFSTGYQASLNNSFKGSNLNTLLTAQASNVAPSISSNGGGAFASVTIPENTTTVTTVTAIDTNLSSTGFLITGGTDAGKFSMNATTGELRFITAPDYENPTDAELNNTYNVRVTATDIFGATDTQEILVTVTNTNDNSPIITSNGGGSSAIIHLVQGDNAVTTIKATDADIDDILTYSIIGGTNSSLFTINASTGLLTFKEESVFGSYEVIVRVSDNVHADTQTITVNVSSTDFTQPTLVISSSDSFLSAGEVCTIFFQFSERIIGFTLADITVTGGDLENLTQSTTDLTLFTAQFTQSGSAAAPGFSVNAGSYTDLSLNEGIAATLSLSFDVTAPTVAITIEGVLLNGHTDIAYGETRVVTFTFSENPGISFNASVVLVQNGQLTNLTQTSDPKIWIASLKATSSVTGPTITVKDKSYTDAAGNKGSEGTNFANLIMLSIGLSNTSDTGYSPNDNITSNRKPIINGAASSSDATVKITVTASNNTVYTYNNVVVNGGLWLLNLASELPSSVSPSGAFPTAGLPEGYVGLTLTGNTSFTTSSGSFLIDITPPPTPVVNNLTTNNSKPTISGTAVVEDLDDFTVSVNYQTYKNGDGKLSYDTGTSVWSLNSQSALPVGVYTVLATVTDAAGNSASSTSINNLTIEAVAVAPTLSAIEVSGEISNTVTVSGNVVSDGGAPVSVRGFCWNTMNEPTIENSKTTNGNGIGAFTGTLLNLEANTTYYVRGYATNAVETIYSNVITFTTPKTEPTNQATGFMPEFVSTTNIALKWTPAATGTQSPDGYLIKLNTNSVSSPQNGVDPDNSTVISDGSANVKVLANATLFDEFTGFAPGTMYNFSIYSFTNNGGQIKYNTSTVPTCKVATLPDEVPNASFIPTSNSTADINWALPESYNLNKQTTIVFVKAVEAIENITPTVNPLLYNSNPIFEIGTPYQGDELAYCVYKGNETSVSISDLLANTNYEVLIFNVVSESNSNGTNSYSTPVTASGKTLNSQTTALNNQPETQFPTVTIENNKIRITNITEKTTISVYNTIGRKIIEKTANNNTSEIELNISGMYLIQVQSEGLKRTTKVSVQN